MRDIQAYMQIAAWSRKITNRIVKGIEEMVFDNRIVNKSPEGGGAKTGVAAKK